MSETERSVWTHLNLELLETIWKFDCMGVCWGGSSGAAFEDTYTPVTLELSQLMPSQGVSHGSSVCPQFGGLFSHSSIKARSMLSVLCSMLFLKKWLLLVLAWEMHVYWNVSKYSRCPFILISVIWRSYFCRCPFIGIKFCRWVFILISLTKIVGFRW